MCFIFILLRSYIFIDKKLTKQTTVTDNIKKLRAATARDDTRGAVGKFAGVAQQYMGQYMGSTWNDMKGQQKPGTRLSLPTLQLSLP